MTPTLIYKEEDKSAVITVTSNGYVYFDVVIE